MFRVLIGTHNLFNFWVAEVNTDQQRVVRRFR
jgi:hypothetical protein